MTVKTPKTGTIRKITRAGIDAVRSGGFVDESFPHDAVIGALANVLPADRQGAFLAYLGPRLALYRARSDHGIKPSKAQKLVDETLDVIQELRARLDGGWPDHVRANLDLVCWNARREHFAAFATRLEDDLRALWNMVAVAERSIEPGKTAAAATVARDWFAHDLVQWFMAHGGMARKSVALQTTRDVMSAAGVPVPNDARELGKLVNGFAQKMRENSH